MHVDSSKWAEQPLLRKRGLGPTRKSLFLNEINVPTGYTAIAVPGTLHALWTAYKKLKSGKMSVPRGIAC